MRMHRLLPCLMLIGTALAVTAPAAPAGPPSVEPSTLQPPPPPGASCRLDGRFVICQTELHEVLDAEPILELPCGTLYETARDDREGIRWYEAFAAWKTAVILQQLYARWVRGESTDPRMADRGPMVAGQVRRAAAILDGTAP